MDEDEKRVLTEKVRNTIKASVHPCYENTSHTELYCRCPYCGDSTKSKTSAHFYIRMEPPFLYNCFKCGRSGRLSRKTLEDLGVYDNDIAIGMASMAAGESDDNKNQARASLSQRKNPLGTRTAYSSRIARAVSSRGSRCISAVLLEVGTLYDGCDYLRCEHRDK